jgi:predicted nucleic acid-binding protein
VTVVDTSAVVDFLLGVGVAAQVERLMDEAAELAAPEVLIFETLAVLRREVLRGGITEPRAAGAVSDLGDLPLELFPSLVLRDRAWELRHNLTVADALFVALAERLGEPLATKDRALVNATVRHSSATALTLA